MESTLNPVSVVLMTVPYPEFTMLKMTELGLVKWPSG